MRLGTAMWLLCHIQALNNTLNNDTKEGLRTVGPLWRTVGNPPVICYIADWKIIIL